MDFINHDEAWNWQGGDYYCFGDNSSLDESSIVFGLSQSESQASMFGGETTPVKACGDFAYFASNHEDMRSKDLDEFREPSSRAKRRRVLQFDSEITDVLYCNEGNSSTNPRSNDMGDSVEEALSEMSRLLSDDSDVTSICGTEGLDPLFEGWISNCFNDTGTKSLPEATNIPGRFGHQNNITEHRNRSGAAKVQARPVCNRPNVVFKGKKSYMLAPENVASSVVYPFAFVKPCSFLGDVTLEDINRRIHAPRRSNQIDDDHISAFSGKPVVAKTKICTDGGRGSITIMRTRG